MKTQMFKGWTLFLLTLFIVFGNAANGQVLRSLSGDNWKDPARTKTWTPPSVTDTLLGETATQTITNKVIDADSNTVSNIVIPWRNQAEVADKGLKKVIVPKKQLTPVTSTTARLEGYDNDAENPSFESGTTAGWTCTGTATSDNTEKFDGEYSLKVVTTSIGQGCYQTVALNADTREQLRTVSVYVKSADPVEVCSMRGATITNECKTVADASSFRIVSFTYTPQSDHTHAGVFVRSVNAASTFRADMVKNRVSNDSIVNISDVKQATDWNSYTPTTNNFTVGNGQLVGKWRKDGTDLKVRISFKSGTTTTYGSTGWTFSIPSGLEIDTDELPVSVTDSYTITGFATGRFNNGGTGNLRSGSVIYINNTTVAVRVDSDRSGYSNENWSSVSTGASNNLTNTQFSLEFSVPIKQWRNSSLDVAATQCQEGELKCKSKFTGIIGTIAGGNVVTSKNTYDSIISSISGTSSDRRVTFKTGYFTEIPTIKTTCIGANGAMGTNPVWNLSTTGFNFACASGSGATWLDIPTSFEITKAYQDTYSFGEQFTNLQNFYVDANEIQVGFDRIDNKPIYQRCHKVTSNVTSNTNLVTWPANLNPVRSINYYADRFLIQAGGEATTENTTVYYLRDTGIVHAYMRGTGFKVGANTKFCMDYTR